ncbi:T9SS type A sorting domain-containing protein [Porphyromonas loveana]|uniref:T9SS type A sorting domain-containing protein n=1 Tax=Porphyromonas loveana TaxID=1884669 RepID=UPI0035A1C757
MKRILLSFLLMLAVCATVETLQAQSGNNVRYRLDRIASSDDQDTYDYSYVNDVTPTAISHSKGEQIQSVDSLFYDENGRLSQVRFYSVNPTTNALELFSVEDYLYVQGNLLIRSTRKSLESEEIIKTVNYYYGCGATSPFEMTIETIDGYLESHTYTYKNNKLASVIIMTQEGPYAPFLETGRQAYTRNAAGDPVELRDSIFVADENMWVEQFVHRYTYDANRNCIRWEVDLHGTPDYAQDFEYDTSIPAASVLFPTHEDFLHPIHPDLMRNMRTKHTTHMFGKSSDPRSIDQSYFYTDMQGGTSVADITVDARIGFYPNPATDVVRIEGAQLLHLTLYDLNGRVVRSMALTGDLAVIGVATLPRGMYIAEVKAADKTIRTKLTLK